jgi:hypothetical protein
LISWKKTLAKYQTDYVIKYFNSEVFDAKEVVLDDELKKPNKV